MIVLPKLKCWIGLLGVMDQGSKSDAAPGGSSQRFPDGIAHIIVAGPGCTRGYSPRLIPAVALNTAAPMFTQLS